MSKSATLPTDLSPPRSLGCCVPAEIRLEGSDSGVRQVRGPGPQDGGWRATPVTLWFRCLMFRPGDEARSGARRYLVWFTRPLQEPVWAGGQVFVRLGQTPTYLIRQDPRGPGSGPGRLPKGNVRRLHHRRGPGPRAHGGQRRSPAAQPAAATGPPQASHHRRVGLRPPLHHRCGTPLRGLQPALRTGLRPLALYSHAPTCPSTSGPTCSAPRGSPALCLTGSPTTFTSWRSTYVGTATATVSSTAGRAPPPRYRMIRSTPDSLGKPERADPCS